MVEKTDSEAVVREIKRRTRKKYSSEEKIRIVLEGLRGEMSIAELCRKEGIQQNVYYKWSKDFLDAGKKRLQGDTVREATSSEVVDLKKENDQLKASGRGALFEESGAKKNVGWLGVASPGNNETRGRRRRWRSSDWWRSRSSRCGRHSRSWM